MGKLGFFVLAVLSFFSVGHDGFAQSASEVHAVGVYEGSPPRSAAYRAAVRQLARRCDKNIDTCGWSEGWSRIQNRFPSQATVKVSRVGVPVTLILSAYNKTEWNVKVAKGVVLKQIIMSGHNRQVLQKTKDVAGVPVKRSFLGAPSDAKGSFFYFFEDDRESPVSYASFGKNGPQCSEPTNEFSVPPHESNFQGALDYLSSKGLALTSAQGAYQLGSFVIDNTTRGINLSKAREAGFCYRNSDGSLSHG